MRRAPTMLMTAGAASLATLAVGVAVPALGEDEPAPPKEGDVVTVIHAGPAPEELRSCLADHGVDVPDGGPLALKRWLAEHRDDKETLAALKACDMGPVGKPLDGPPCGIAVPAPGPGKPGKGTFKFRVERGDHVVRRLDRDGE
jgi:hypothetical protein